MDTKTAVEIGLVANAEEALVGSVYEGRQSIEIFAQMIDTETSEILFKRDVFHEDKSPERIRTMTEGLALKFKNAMPLVQGNILKLEGSQLFADIGKEEEVRKGARLVGIPLQPRSAWVVPTTRLASTRFRFRFTWAAMRG